MRKLKTSLFSADRLAQMVATGTLAMPDFQRDFVWEPWRVVDFLESVANGWPTGALLFLEATPSGVPPLFHSKGFKDGPSLEGGRPDYYVLDGQQRLTALYHAYFDASSETAYYADHSAENGADIIRAVPRRRSKPILSRDEVALIRNLAGVAPQQGQTRFPFAALNETVDDLLRLLPGFRRGEYQVPVVTLPWDVELAALAKIFETVNLSGVRLNAFDLMVAVLYPQGFDLRKCWNDALEIYESLTVFGVDGVQVLRLIALWNRAQNPRTGQIAGARGVRQSDILRIPAKFVEQKWAEAVERFVAAIEYCSRELGMVNPLLIPSESMLLTAAALSDPKTKSTLDSWFWRSCVMQSHAQGANTQVISDFDNREMPADSGTLTSAADIDVLLRQPIARNAIAVRGLCCALVRNGAREVLSGQLLAKLEPSTELQIKSVTELVGDEPIGATVGDVVIIQKGTLSRLRETLATRESSIEHNLQSQQLTKVRLSGETLQIAAQEDRIRFYSKFLGAPQ